MLLLLLLPLLLGSSLLPPPPPLTHRHLAPQVCKRCLLLPQPCRQPRHLPRQPRGSRQLAIHALRQPPHLGQPPLVTGSTPCTRHSSCEQGSAYQGDMAAHCIVSWGHCSPLVLAVSSAGCLLHVQGP
jgi:hypothetical protein